MSPSGRRFLKKSNEARPAPRRSPPGRTPTLSRAPRLREILAEPVAPPLQRRRMTRPIRILLEAEEPCCQRLLFTRHLDGEWRHRAGHRRVKVISTLTITGTALPSSSRVNRHFFTVLTASSSSPCVRRASARRAPHQQFRPSTRPPPSSAVPWTLTPDAQLGLVSLISFGCVTSLPGRKHQRAATALRVLLCRRWRRLLRDARCRIQRSAGNGESPGGSP